MAEHVFISLITGSQCHNLNCILAELIHHISDQVKSLLICKTGNDSDHHYFRILLQSQFSLELNLILHFFLTEGCGIIILCNTGICLRIENIVINSVYNTSETVGTGTHQSVQTFSVERCLDFLSISVADCSHRICKYNTALQEIGILISFQLICCKVIIRKACDILYSLNIPNTLEFQVMYGHNSFYIPEKLILLEAVMKIYRNQSCLPVMTVDHIRSEANHRKN